LEFKALHPPSAKLRRGKTMAGASSHVFIRTPQHTSLRLGGYGVAGGPPTSSAVLVNLGPTSLLTEETLPTK